jgi:flagellar basal-body rod protein FlgC
MISSVNSTLSALKAFGKKMDVIADNVANVNTEGYKKSRALLKSGSNNEVHAEVNQINSPGPPSFELRDGQMTERELSNVDLVEEISQTITTQRGYEANLKTLKTQDEMSKAVIDILA